MNVILCMYLNKTFTMDAKFLWEDNNENELFYNTIHCLNSKYKTKPLSDVGLEY